MDRINVYPFLSVDDTDILQMNRNIQISIAALTDAILGHSQTLLNNFTCTPASPASLNVLVTSGEIYAINQPVDATTYGGLDGNGGLDADTDDLIIKQGILNSLSPTPSPIQLSCPAPAGGGNSVNYLIQFGFEELDNQTTNREFYNPSITPPNYEVSVSQSRSDIVLVNAKTGVAAPTGTQVTPSPDAGYTGGFVVTVANGQTTITSGDIADYPTAPFIVEKLMDKISQATGDGRYKRLEAYVAQAETPGGQVITPSATPVKLTMSSTATFDTASFWNSGSTRFIPNIEGYYRISSIISTIISDSTGSLSLRLYKNGTFYSNLNSTTYTGTDIISGDFVGSIIVFANGSTDYFELYFLNDTADDVEIDPSIFDIEFIGTGTPP